MPAHAVTFWTGPNVAAPFEGGAVVGQHGSWNRTAFGGHAFVLFPKTAAGLGAARELVTDAAGKVRWGRPAVAPDGGLYLGDELSGTIYHLVLPKP